MLRVIINMKKVFFGGIMIFFSLLTGVIVSGGNVNLLQQEDDTVSYELVGLEFVDGEKYVFTKVDDFINADFVISLNNTDDIEYFLENYSNMGDMERIAFLHNNFNVPIDVLLDMNSLLNSEVSE